MMLLPSLEHRSHCMECRECFGLVERSEDYPTTCTACVGRLKPRIACMKCERIIERSEWAYDTGWSIVCRRCARTKLIEIASDCECVMRHLADRSGVWVDAENLLCRAHHLIEAIDDADNAAMHEFGDGIERLKRAVGV